MSNPYTFAPPPTRLFADWARSKSIGVISPSYGSEKVSYGLVPEGYSYHKLFRVPLHRLERTGTYLAHTPIVLDHPVELVHSFNDLPVGIRPYVVSFENELPRYLGSPTDQQMNRGYDMLESGRCKRVLALSQAAADAMRVRLRRAGREALMEKVSVFRGTVFSPPQGDGRTRTPLTERPLRVLFVGRDPLRKGLLPMLDALDECRRRGACIEATVVCAFDPRDMKSASNPIDPAVQVERMRQMPGVTWHAHLPNREIHRLMQSHDVLLFPTLDESLGWVAVEAALAGMVVVSTRIFALPELVLDGQTGVLMPMNTNDHSRWVGMWQSGTDFEQEVSATFAALREHMVQALLGFVDNPSMVARMGDAARRHMESLYGFAGAQRQLADIYVNALSQS